MFRWWISFIRADLMNCLKRLSSIFALTIISALSVTAPTGAETITGTFQGNALVEVTPYINFEPGVTTTYYEQSSLGFTLVTDQYYNYMSLNIHNLELSTYGQPESFFSYSITDGIPGQSADNISASMDIITYHAPEYGASFFLTDPSGEFIGPNGNGNPSDVSVTADIYYLFANVYGATESVFIEFHTIPEPSSIVMATSAALLILAWPILRSRIGTAYALTRGRARLNQS
jgi:hypothetical protein